MRALVHVGLAALLVLAPAFCCCNIRLLTGLVAAADRLTPTCPACPEHLTPQPAPPASPCCHSEATKATPKSCCHQAEPEKKPAPKSPAPQPSQCCFDQRPVATAPEAATKPADPQPTGELLPLALVGLAGISPEHLGLLGGLEPPERAGVDTRSATLFDRHVLRC